MGKQQVKYNSDLLSPEEQRQFEQQSFDRGLKEKGYSEDQVRSMNQAYRNVAQEKMPQYNLGVQGESYKPEPHEYEQSMWADFTESIYNSFVDAGEGIANLIPLAAQASGSESKFWDNWMTGVSNWADNNKFFLSDAANRPLSDDWGNFNAWASGLGQGLGFMGSMLTGGGAFAKGASAIGKVGSSVNTARKVGQFITGTVSMAPELYDEAIKNGIPKADAARLALGISGIVSLTEGAALEWMGKSIAKPVSTKAAKEAFNESIVQLSKRGALAEADFGNTIRLTGMKFGQKMKGWGAGALEPFAIESAQEFSQEYIEEGLKQLYDKVIAPDKEAGKGAYGADVMSWDTFKNALGSGIIGGLIGGSGSVLSINGSLMSGIKGETLFNYVNSAEKTGNQKNLIDLGYNIKRLAAEKKLANGPEEIVQHVEKIRKFVNETKGLNIQSDAARYQLFQMMELEKGMNDKVENTFKVTDDVHQLVANTYNKNKKLAGIISGYLNEDMKMLVQEQEPLAKNKDAFEDTLGKYVGLYKSVITGKADQKMIEEQLPKISYAAREAEKQRKKAEEKAAEKTEETSEIVKDNEANETVSSTQEGADQATRSDVSNVPMVDDESYQNFVETGEVSNEILKSIAIKIRDNQKLTDQERAIFQNKTSDINRVLMDNNIGEQKYKEENKNAIQEQSTGALLQRQPQETGSTGSERPGMESSQQGEEVASQSQEKAEKGLTYVPDQPVLNRLDISREPTSLEHAVLQRLAKGTKLSAEEFSDSTGLNPDKDVATHPFERLLLKKENNSRYKQTSIHQLWEDMKSDPNTAGLVPDDSQDFANQVFDIIKSTAGKQGVYKRLAEISSKINGQEMSYDEAQSMQDYYDSQDDYLREQQEAAFKFQTVQDSPIGTLKSGTTRQLLKDRPDLAKSIIDRLRVLYPEVRISEGGLFDENGNWKELGKDKYGMAYRNGLFAAVAWANDSLLETPPHEYAHLYIDMFRDNSMVKKALQGYTEEELVTKMGQYFAGRQMTNAFSKWISDFWAMIRSLFGSPDIARQLSQAFYKGKRLAPNENMGTGIYSFQERGNPQKRIEGTFDVNGTGLQEKEMKMMSQEQAREELFKEIIGGDDSDSKAFNANWVKNTLNDLFHRLIYYADKKDRNNEYRNMAGLDQRTINDGLNSVKSIKTCADIGNYLAGKIEYNQLGENEKKTVDTALLAWKRIEYRKRLNESVFAGNGKTVSLDQVKNTVDEEIQKTAGRRKELYAKVKNKQFKKVLEFTEKTLLRATTAPRLDAKYLSGSEASTLSKIFYDSLNHADSVYKGIIRKFNGFLHFQEKGEQGKFKKWGTFNTPKQNIDYYKGHEFELQVGDTVKKVKLTNSEALTLYMNLRQTDESRGTSPAAAIRDSGFRLDDVIDGRDITINDILQFPRTQEEIVSGVPSKQAMNFMKSVETNPELKDIVSQIDKAMDYMYDETNRTFEQEQGYGLPKIPNYFPIYTGEKSLQVGQAKNAIEEFRAGHERMGTKDPLRIADINKVLNFHENNGALYASHALPVSNNRKLLDKIRNKYHNTMEAVYIDKMDGLLNNLEDSSFLSANQGPRPRSGRSR